MENCLRCAAWVLWCGVLLLFATAAHAGAGGRISGTAKDATASVIAHATVTLINTGTGVSRSVVTDANGVYSFPDVPVGRYNLKVESPGFAPYERTGVTVDANSALLIDAVLRVGAKTESVTVTSNPLQVETSARRWAK